VYALNERIKKIRKYYGLTLEAFGKRVGITRSAVGRIEKGERKVTEQMILSICREFNVNEDWFRNGGSDDKMIKIEYGTSELNDFFAEITAGKDPFIADMLLKYKRLSPLHKKAIWEIYEELKKEEEG